MSFSSLVLRGRASLRRRLSRGRVQAIAEEILSGIDLSTFHARFDRYPTKFTNIEHWLPEAVARFFDYELDQLPFGSRILDLGCGAGYFQVVCRHFGHDAWGTDLDDDPFYNEVIPFLNVQRIIHRIDALTPLPQFEPGPFDVVTTFMTCFNKLPGGAPWTEKEWMFLIDDLMRQVRPGGQFLVKFNRNHEIARPYPPALPGALSRQFRHQVIFFGDSMIVRAL